MILLEHINTITHDLIMGWLNAEYVGRLCSHFSLTFCRSRTPGIETKCSDFDGCQLHVWSDGDTVNVSLKSGAAQSLLANGGRDVLSQVYEGALVGSAESGYDVQIAQNVAGITTPQDKGMNFSLL